MPKAELPIAGPHCKPPCSHLIFVNFRNGDEDTAPMLAYETLAKEFGRKRIFLSSETLEPGADFRTGLSEHASNCAVLVALIGPRWLTIKGADGRPKIMDPDDWVQKEISLAMDAKRGIVPVLLGDAKRLRADDLPDSLSWLASRQFCRLRRADQEADLQKLKEAIETYLPDIAKKRPKKARRVGNGPLLNADRIDGYAAVTRIESYDGYHGPPGDGELRAKVVSKEAEAIVNDYRLVRRPPAGR